MAKCVAWGNLTEFSLLGRYNRCLHHQIHKLQRLPRSLIHTQRPLGRSRRIPDDYVTARHNVRGSRHEQLETQALALEPRYRVMPESGV